MRWLERRLWIGRYASIDLYLHWSLALIVVYVLSMTRGEDRWVLIMALAQLIGMYVCVTLHEYGHALAARRYGIGTADITLLAIGGIARLRQMPRIAMQELIVAIAGPAVNVVIAAILIAVLYVTDASWVMRIGDVLQGAFSSMGSEAAAAGDVALLQLRENVSQPNWIGFALALLLVNVALVLFNFVPAFPMDGGRCLRAMLAMLMDYRRATYVASRLGWVVAAIMALVALSSPQPMWVLLGVSAFIVYAGLMEYDQVEITERVRGLTAGAAMIPMTDGVSINSTLAEVVACFQVTPMSRLPLVGLDKIVTGTIGLNEVARRIDSHGFADDEPVGSWASRESDLEPVVIDEGLEDFLPALRSSSIMVPVVNQLGTLVGMLDPQTAIVRNRLFRSDVKTQIDEWV